MYNNSNNDNNKLIFLKNSNNYETMNLERCIELLTPLPVCHLLMLMQTCLERNCSPVSLPWEKNLICKGLSKGD